MKSSSASAGILAVISLFAGCSLNYVTTENTESTVPEFVFSDLVFNRYENGKLTMTSSAIKIEQYKNDNSTFARGLKFTTFQSDGTPDTEGYCSLLAADTGTEQYSFFNNIDILNHKRNIQIFAKNLHWDGKTEQLTSGKNDTLTMVKGGATLTGTGFSASAISDSFLFSGTVSGSITTKEDTTEQQPQDSDNSKDTGT